MWSLQKPRNVVLTESNLKCTSNMHAHFHRVQFFIRLMVSTVIIFGFLPIDRLP